MLKFLERYGFDDLALDIAVNHQDDVVRIWTESGTVWENYAAYSVRPGKPAKPDFFGWTGLPPIAVLLEHRHGLRPNVPENTLVWDVRNVEACGVRRYPFGPVDFDLTCAARSNPRKKPKIEVLGPVPLRIDLRWAGRADGKGSPWVEEGYLVLLARETTGVNAAGSARFPAVVR